MIYPALLTLHTLASHAQYHYHLRQTWYLGQFSDWQMLFADSHVAIKLNFYFRFRQMYGPGV